MWEEGGIVGGIMHISSNNLSRVRSTFNGGRSPVTNARTESGPSMSERPPSPPQLFLAQLWQTTTTY